MTPQDKRYDEYRRKCAEMSGQCTITGDQSVCSWCDKIYDHDGVQYADLNFCCVTCADEYRYSLD